MRFSKIGALLGAIVLAVCPAPGLRASDSLADARNAARTPGYDPPAEPSAPRTPSHDHDHCYDCDNDGMSGDSYLALCALAGIVVTSPYWVPHGLIEAGNEGTGYFDEPYDGQPGTMLFAEPVDGCPPDSLLNWSGRLRGEYADDFDSLERYSGQLLVEHTNRFGADLELNYWREEVSPEVGDELWTGDANLVYRFAQNPYVQLRSGLGMAWLSDRHETDIGLNFTYGGDVYPLRPFVFSADLDAGWVGEAWLIHLRATAGVTYKRVEIYTGYDYLEIGQAQLDGWVTGVRVLF